MSPRRTPQLRGFDYVGRYRYFLTICAYRRRRAFRAAEVVEPLLLFVRQSAEALQFALIAYCFMPDHLHLLVEGRAEDADLRTFVNLLKQRSGFWWARRCGTRLWQDGFHDRVLRSEESTADVCRYIWGNPVRAGLVDRVEDYGFSGPDSARRACV